ncbi:fasciclin domain-containing protein [Microvirga terrae]|uniref:Fasciclin domain-containing protein n=1 Tax=Microvirga terrae TaxID=2740529 RepID=A0ABY5RWI5_9HYPH|nr:MULTISPECIES: fasciclin domain-containing protein [Microvirga]MBQ0822122.1 fasciclin domain-containing protein [Microvirga sp. HBU67558]UVF21611.1 fasciclin domain-containing protein [Microvirga terrae]
MTATYRAYAVIAMLATASPAAAADIVETAVTNGNFKTLTAALQAAGLVDTLKGQGPYTVFAPTDEAFKKLPAGTVENLLKPENKAQLQKVLTYHVVAGNVKSGDLKGKTTSAQTVEGTAVRIDASGNAVKVNEAVVTQADVNASNGVIHVIDSVIMPRS